MYYWITRTEDGECYIKEYTKEKLLDELNEYIEQFTPNDFKGEINGVDDIMYWDENNLIIKGKIVKPIPEEKITSYGIE